MIAAVSGAGAWCWADNLLVRKPGRYWATCRSRACGQTDRLVQLVVQDGLFVLDDCRRWLTLGRVSDANRSVSCDCALQVLQLARQLVEVVQVAVQVFAGLYAKSRKSNGCDRSGAAPPVVGVGRFFTVRS